MNLLARNLRFLKLQLHQVPTLFFLSFWSLLLWGSRLKFFKLQNVVTIMTYLSSFWMILFWTYWMSKKKPTLGLNFFMTSMHFLLRYFFIFVNFMLNNKSNFLHFFIQKYIELYWLYLCCSGWCKSHILLSRYSEGNISSWFGYCRYSGGASCAWNFNTFVFYTFLECKFW